MKRTRNEPPAIFGTPDFQDVPPAPTHIDNAALLREMQKQTKLLRGSRFVKALVIVVALAFLIGLIATIIDSVSRRGYF
jgi:hypothetical protein